MGLSSSKSSQKQTATVDPSVYSKPYIDSAVSTLQPGYNAAVANNASLMPRINSSLDYLGDNISGKYLDGNPNLEAIIGRTNRDITTGVGSRFEGAGRYGSGQHASILARALGDADSALRFQDYSTERGYQDSAAKALPGVVGVSAALPQAAGNTYSDAVAQILGKYNTTSGTSVTKSSPSLFDSILAAAATASKFIPGAGG